MASKDGALMGWLSAQSVGTGWPRIQGWRGCSVKGDPLPLLRLTPVSAGPFFVWTLRAGLCRPSCPGVGPGAGRHTESMRAEDCQGAW